MGFTQTLRGMSVWRAPEGRDLASAVRNPSAKSALTQMSSQWTVGSSMVFCVVMCMLVTGTWNLQQQSSYETERSHKYMTHGKG